MPLHRVFLLQVTKPSTATEYVRRKLYTSSTIWNNQKTIREYNIFHVK